MSTNNQVIQNNTLMVSGIEVQVVRKSIKNLHLGVYPPDGRVRVAVPQHLTDDNVRLAVIAKLGWIKKQQTTFQSQVRQSEREMVPGESHYVWGRRYRLEVVEGNGRHRVFIKNNSKLVLCVAPHTTTANREMVLQEWYRAEIKQRLPALLAKWQPIIGKSVAGCSIKKMKTKWGSCNIARQHIWLNLELAKKPVECLEYILVHEMVHLLERHHNDNFRVYMNQFLPQWRAYRDVLNQYPLAYEAWGY